MDGAYGAHQDPKLVTISSSEDTVNTVAASGAAVTLPAMQTAAAHDVTLTAPCTLTFPAASAGASFTLVLRQDATGGRVVTWPAVKWPGGAAPTITPTASAVDVIQFYCANGTNWLGFPAGYDLR